MPPWNIVLHTFAQLLHQVEAMQQKNKSENAGPDTVRANEAKRG